MFIDWQKVNEMEKTGQVEPLENECLIEDFILAVKNIDDKVSFYEKLKKNRVAKIQEEIDKLEKNKQLFKSVIEETMKKFGIKKSLSFPGIGRVSVRSVSGKWVIENEEQLLKDIETKISEEDMDKIVKLEPKVSKKELYLALDNLDITGKLPEGVKKEDDRTSLTISYDNEGITGKLEEFEEKKEQQEIEKKSSQPTKVETFDGLNF